VDSKVCVSDRSHECDVQDAITTIKRTGGLEGRQMHTSSSQMNCIDRTRMALIRTT
jgi:hypothetical protein